MITSKIPNRVEILKAKFTQSTALPFRELLPPSIIQQVIDELKIKYYRRIFDPFVTLWAFLSQILDVEKSCQNAVSRGNHFTKKSSYAAMLLCFLPLALKKKCALWE